MRNLQTSFFKRRYHDEHVVRVSPVLLIPMNSAAIPRYRNSCPTVHCVNEIAIVHKSEVLEILLGDLGTSLSKMASKIHNSFTRYSVWLGLLTMKDPLLALHGNFDLQPSFIRCCSPPRYELSRWLVGS